MKKEKKESQDSAVQEVEAAATPVEATQEVIEKAEFELQQIRERFGPYRTPTEETIPKFKQIQEAAMRFAELICQLCPNSQQRSTALTQLEMAKMSANASIAIHTPRTTARKGAQA